MRSVIEERYKNEIKAVDLTKFDGFEYDSCREYSSQGDTFVEVCEEHEAEFWSVYGHLPTGGVQWQIDVPDKATAEIVTAILEEKLQDLLEQTKRVISL